MLLTREDTWRPWWAWLFSDDAADGLQNVRNVDWVQRRVVSVRPVLEPRKRFSVRSITGGCLIFGRVGGALEMSSDCSRSAAYALRPAYL